jgi:DNA-binding transcriptional LysR family regulator
MRHLTDLRSLQSFVTVAREGNVSRAADLLALSQPAVSLQLKKLAADTGLELFRRVATGLELTPDGAALLVKAEQVLAAMIDLDQTARGRTGQVRGTLRIGTIIDPDFIRLGGFLAALVDRAPQLQAQLFHGISGEVPPRLHRDEIDIGFVLDAPQPAGADLLHHRKLTEFRYRVIAPAGWARRVEGLGWADLAALPWIGTPPQSIHHRLLKRRFADHGVVQNSVALVDQEPSMLAMVRSGVGMSLCRESIALHEKQANGLVVVEALAVETSVGIAALQRRCEEAPIALALDVLAKLWGNQD